MRFGGWRAIISRDHHPEFFLGALRSGNQAMDQWKIPIFNREYIFKRVIFQPAMLDYQRVPTKFNSSPLKMEAWKTILGPFLGPVTFQGRHTLNFRGRIELNYVSEGIGSINTWIFQAKCVPSHTETLPKGRCFDTSGRSRFLLQKKSRKYCNYPGSPRPNKVAGLLDDPWIQDSRSYQGQSLVDLDFLGPNWERKNPIVYPPGERSHILFPFGTFELMSWESKLPPPKLPPK